MSRSSRFVRALAVAGASLALLAAPVARAQHRIGEVEKAAGGLHAEPAHVAVHGEHAEHDESAPPGEINYWRGLIAASDKHADAMPLLFRHEGEPAPLLASVLNFAVFAFLIVRFAKKPLAEALVKRKETILRDIDEATKLKAEADARLADYQAKLRKIEDEVERVRREFREQGERDRARIVKEAEERRVALRKDAEFLLEQELKQMHLDVTRETVDRAVALASELLAKKLTAADHDRFGESFLAELGKLPKAAPRAIAARSVPPVPPRGGVS